VFSQNPYVLDSIPHRLGLEMIIERDGHTARLGLQQELPLDALQEFLVRILIIVPRVALRQALLGRRRLLFWIPILRVKAAVADVALVRGRI
jgi:hypothetical protein